jgi:phosphohistidine phosphatase SixA
LTVILLRHASAGDREAWNGDDRLRPLDERGRKQATAVAEELRARGVKHVVSSPYVRCVQTVAPLGLEVVPDERLAEGAPVEKTRALLASLDEAVACTHGDVVENVIGRSLKKGAAVVLDGNRELEEIAAP